MHFTKVKKMHEWFGDGLKAKHSSSHTMLQQVFVKIFFQSHHACIVLFLKSIKSNKPGTDEESRSYIQLRMTR